MGPHISDLISPVITAENPFPGRQTTADSSSEEIMREQWRDAVV
jgi:hypothetical protein